MALSSISVILGTPNISHCDIRCSLQSMRHCVNVSSIALAASAVCTDYDHSININGNVLEDEVMGCAFLGSLVRYVGQVNWPEWVEWIT
jgi:hypothetical protein